MNLKRKVLFEESNDEFMQMKKEEEKKIPATISKIYDLNQETFDLFAISESDERRNSDEIDDSLLKGVQIIDDDDNNDDETEGKQYFFKFSTKTSTTAYYKCMNTLCGGRAAARYSLSKEEGVPCYRFDEEIRVTTPCTKKYEEHPWEKNK